ncbi:hypothetical protein B296_00046149 [Ensete ventricosum]|uniref:Uncharacterized protein n=1 Tax=Ensete ventricosum TaxID=4639 RepID=A0A426WW89_ENSVE|nr:hypothetical protein B296_00046149 [Ensete ventricosum]
MGFHQEFARRFTEGIGKLAGNTLGDHREKTRRLTARTTSKSPVPRFRLAKPRPTGELSYLNFSDMVGFWLQF